MPTVNFDVETDAPFVRLNVRKSGQLTSVPLDHGSGEKDFPSGHVATAVLFIEGPIGTKAKLEISQIVSGEKKILALMDFMEITEIGGKATADVGFVVR